MKARTFFYAVPVAACILCSAVAAEDGVTANPNKAGDGVQVGVAGRDGVTASGGEAYVTRNGATEKLSKDLILPSGVIAQPDGTIVLKDGTKVTLKSDQLLTFEGKVMELPPDPNVNPGARVAVPESTTTTSSTQTNASFTTGTSSGGRFDRGIQGGSVFVGSSGLPFMGTLRTDGSIVTTDGRTIPFDSTIRAVTFARDGTPALGRINVNGSITQADGSILFADGSVRTAEGTVINPPRDAQGNPIRSAIPQNTTNQPLTNANGQPANTNAQPANPNAPATNHTTTGSVTNSPNNAGTVNTGNTRNTGNSTNNTGPVNNPSTGNHTNATGNRATAPNRNAGNSQAAGSSARPSGARSGASSGGGGTGTGASGAGGASGGSGGGATR